MKTFPTTQRGKVSNLNYQLPKAGRIVRVFESNITLKPEIVDVILVSACSSHNWFRKFPSTYLTESSVDHEDI